MSFSGGKFSIMSSSSLVVLLIISVLHIWVFSPSRVGALRILPESALPLEKRTQAMKSSKNQTQEFYDYFKKRALDLNSTRNGTLEDSKRRIPSCPDPLHN